jgi:AraC family transcriptional regulator
MLSLLSPGSFFGQTMRSQDAIGFHFAAASIAPHTQVPLHAHERATLYFILDGACAERYGERSRYSGPQSLIFHPATHAHSGVWQNHNGLCFNIEITPQRMEDLRAYAPIPLDAVEFGAGIPNQIALRLYREFLQPDAVSPLVMEGMALELMAAISRAVMRPRELLPPRWLRTVIPLLEAQYRENLSLAEIAASVEVHPSHLARVFRQHYHCSIGDYVRRLRMDYICQELTTSNLSLGEIAIAAGFADQSHFTKNFKRSQGITPAEYRHRVRGCVSETTK